MPDKLLKLKAKDSEDIQVISAVLQDAIAPVSDMIWRAEEKNFVMVVQRLCREAEDDRILNRIRTAVNIQGVESVQTRGIDLGDMSRMLDLLMMTLDGQTLHFLFA